MYELMTLLAQALKADEAYKSSATQNMPDQDQKLDALFDILSEVKQKINRCVE